MQSNTMSGKCIQMWRSSYLTNMQDIFLNKCESVNHMTKTVIRPAEWILNLGSK